MELAEEILNKHASQLNPSEELINKLESASKTFLSKVDNSITTQEMFSTTAKYYASEFINEELDQLVAFYSSPLGKKEARVTDTVIPKLVSHLHTISDPVMESATKEFVDEVTLLVKSCNCAK